MSSMSLLPIISEKALAASEAEQTYSFLVPLGATKLEIAKAVNEQFGVKPKAVNTLRLKGKPKTTMVQRGRRRIKGQRSTVKKALVTLAKGDKITLGEEKK